LGVLIALASFIMTGVALAVGTLAVFGYQSFADEVTKRVSRVAENLIPGKVNEYFGGAAFKTTLEGTVKEQVTAGSWQRGTVEEPGAIQLEDSTVKRYPGKRKVKSDAGG
jgi:hypothetical protein